MQYILTHIHLYTYCSTTDTQTNRNELTEVTTSNAQLEEKLQIIDNDINLITLAISASAARLKEVCEHESMLKNKRKDAEDNINASIHDEELRQSDLHNQISVRKHTNSMYESKLNKLIVEVSLAEKELDALLIECKKLNTGMDSCTSELMKLNASDSQLKADIDNYTLQIDSSTNILASISTNANNLEQKQDEMFLSVTERMEQIKQLRKEEPHVKYDLEELMLKINSSIARLETDDTDAQAKLHIIRESKACKVSNIQSLIDENRCTESMLLMHYNSKDMMNSIAAADEDISQYNTQYAELVRSNIEADAIAERTLHIRDSTAVVTNRISTLQQSISEEKNRIAELETHYHTTAAAIKDSAGKYKPSSKAISNLTKDLAAYEADMKASLDKEVCSIVKTIDTLVLRSSMLSVDKEAEEVNALVLSIQKEKEKLGSLSVSGSSSSGSDRSNLTVKRKQSTPATSQPSTAGISAIGSKTKTSSSSTRLVKPLRFTVASPVDTVSRSPSMDIFFDEYAPAFANSSTAPVTPTSTATTAAPSITNKRSYK